MHFVWWIEELVKGGVCWLAGVAASVSAGGEINLCWDESLEKSVHVDFLLSKHIR